MIEDLTQYEVTLTALEKFKCALKCYDVENFLQALVHPTEYEDVDPRLRKACREAMVAQIEELEEELSAFEADLDRRFAHLGHFDTV